MKICHAWIYFFFLSGLITAEIPVLTVQEGGNITHGCSFFVSGKRKLFCKGECEKEDILVETTEDRAQRGRYGIEYIKAAGVFSSSALNVSITQLTKFDTGLYRCSLARQFFVDSSEDFEIRVVSAPVNSKPNRIPGPISPSVPSASTLTTTWSLSSSSGSSTPSLASPEATNQSQQQHMTSAAGPDQTTPGVLLYLGLTVVVLIIVLSAAVLIFCRKKARKPKEPPEETEYGNVTEVNREYEEIGEGDRQSRSPPVEISTVYACAKYTKPNAAETTDGYDFATAASSQKKTEDTPTKVTYTALEFSNHTAAPLSSAPCGDADNVTYSQVNTSSTTHHSEDASAPLYSTVTLH